jgi:hypothetical protein
MDVDFFGTFFVVGPLHGKTRSAIDLNKKRSVRSKAGTI